MITVGASVRCTYRTVKPELQPWLATDHVGVVLALDDPRAWKGSIAFGGLVGGALGNAAAVSAHVRSCLARGLLRDRTPVLYSFGVRWDTTRCLYLAVERADDRDMRETTGDGKLWEAESEGECAPDCY